MERLPRGVDALSTTDRGLASETKNMTGSMTNQEIRQDADSKIVFFQVGWEIYLYTILK